VEGGWGLLPDRPTISPEAFARFKELADRKRDITDRDLEAIVSEQGPELEAVFSPSSWGRTSTRPAQLASPTAHRSPWEMHDGGVERG